MFLATVGAVLSLGEGNEDEAVSSKGLSIVSAANRIREMRQ
jgi:hypothetical protein